MIVVEKRGKHRKKKRLGEPLLFVFSIFFITFLTKI